MTDLVGVPVTIMRGGTSRALFFNASDLPDEVAARDRVIMSAMGSGDPRQIDGLGGADILTSKLAIIARSADSDTDVDYTFGQVGIATTTIDYATNCGNISAAVGLYAIEEGLVKAEDPETTVHVNNVNTGDLLLIHVPVADGKASTDGDYVIAGVPGSGPEIRLDFSDTVGSLTGSLLPSGVPRDTVSVPELGHAVEMSIVDVGKCAVFFRAEDIGLQGDERPEDVTAEVLERYAAVQRAAARHVGLDPSSGLPRPVTVAAPAGFTDLAGRKVAGEDVDLLARLVILPPPYLHKAYAGTGAVCLGAAARLPWTVPNHIASAATEDVVRIGHPSGVMPVRIRYQGSDLVEASFSRTARRIAQGEVFVRP